MKWQANVTAFTTTPQTGTSYSLFPIEADNEPEAARSAAGAVARMLYQRDEASTGFVNRIDDHVYRVTIGIVRHLGGINGHTLEIFVSEYRGVQ